VADEAARDGLRRDDTTEPHDPARMTAAPVRYPELETHEPQQAQPKSGEHHRAKRDRHAGLGMLPKLQPNTHHGRTLGYDQIGQATDHEQIADESRQRRRERADLHRSRRRRHVFELDRHRSEAHLLRLGG